MWTANRPPSRPQRTPSVHSIASVHSTSRPNSMTSPQLRRSGYESDQSSDTANDDEFFIQNANFPRAPSNGMNNMPAMWQSGRQQSGSAVSRLSQKFGSNVQVAEIQAPPPLRTQHQHPQGHDESSPDDDTHSRASTLNDEPDFEFPEKTPTSLPRKMAKDMKESSAPHIAGPLEQQLASLMSKLIFIERENPVVSVTPEDYKELQDRVKVLEEEKKTWWKRHEAIWALRDEDVENNIKIRGMLAKDRRALEGMTKLRDDDLVNLQIVRVKLAEATRKIERLESSSGRSSPMRGRPGSMIFERRDTTDLFAKAKSDALEQRVLELEKRNSELIAQMQHMRMGVSGTASTTSVSSIDALNSVTAHKAWKDTVADLELKVKEKDNQIARLKAGGSQYIGTTRSGLERSASAIPVSAGNGADWRHIEAIHEEHASYREKVGAKMQALRSEKEVLQKELHRKEDDCHVLEVKVQSLQRRVVG
ncbi:hypothetical protein BDV96DRAFT_617348 [Lophiotrema nucula]|uniref:Uncharacterized protein n=1 Tax=Lophiotrema nucula TaxID=690887 RepID=A0A6A5YID3_9PLEO|nr:hypothetical protein BDV96DRAFT_617348 [Lophiotrema nucula]